MRRNPIVSIAMVAWLGFSGLASDARAQAALIGLGTPPGGDYANYALDISDDGSVVVGQTELSSDLASREGFRWTGRAATRSRS